MTKKEKAMLLHIEETEYEQLIIIERVCGKDSIEAARQRTRWATVYEIYETFACKII